MRTSLRLQADAVKRAMKHREKYFTPAWKRDLEGFRERDKQWIALNDAYSTLTSLMLNDIIITNFEKPIGKPKGKIKR